MNRTAFALLLTGLSAAITFGAEGPASPAARTFDQQLTMVEHELVPLAEAMPADKYNFAPTHGEFKGVRTFGQQISHIAAVMYLVSSSALGEKNPGGADENGPASLKTKDDIVKYLKDAIAYSHKAMNALTESNLLELVRSPFGEDKVPRVSLATTTVWHTFDHYGQMVVYARMNGIVPPASRR
ncbi:MAG TPA: DinB family protein [Bryobacteraceae bacterium]|nr:DinB family protein [Bryobacteraceae bacterium]